ncbi:MULTISPECIES: hypothetical protein [unclassified Flavobacterium]|uniref:hypothetical protein n=1 Tax=unclassified Flavobacterium TaxID=196869 RepID=UPI001F147DA6|nr:MULTISPECIES: hypothetical protein [unclassified Flavobacterium]UMY66531.1 hypothetical protein MKO97_03870 [Flavobacterium sp. HJ-32-4]
MIYDFILTSFLTPRGFRKIREVNEGTTHFTQYTSDIFSITVEQYRRYVYAILSKVGIEDGGVELYNLIEFAHREQNLKIENAFFHEDIPLDEAIRKQIEQIVSLFETYASEIEDFFRSDDYLAKTNELRDFVIAQNPNLFRQQ